MSLFEHRKAVLAIGLALYMPFNRAMIKHIHLEGKTMKKGIITKIITAAIATTLVIGGATVMAAPAGNVETGITYDVVIGKTNETLSREYTFIPEHDGI